MKMKKEKYRTCYLLFKEVSKFICNMSDFLSTSSWSSFYILPLKEERLTADIKKQETLMTGPPISFFFIRQE